LREKEVGVEFSDKGVMKRREERERREE